MRTTRLLVIYTWPDGREEVRYERPFPSDEAHKLIGEVRALREAAELRGDTSPYTYRYV